MSIEEREKKPANPLIAGQTGSVFATMFNRLAQLEKAKQKYEDDKEISSPKIQRVPTFLRQNAELAKYYSPRLISFGPIHHGSENLKQGEHYKLLWTLMFVEDYNIKEYKENIIKDNLKKLLTHQDTNRCEKFLHKNIEELKKLLTHQDTNEGAKFLSEKNVEIIGFLLGNIIYNIQELKRLFTEDAIGKNSDEDLAWMLFVDGCSLLYFMKKVNDQDPVALTLKLGQLLYVHSDIMLLENQLPRKVLEMLSRERGADLVYLLGNYRTMGDCERVRSCTGLRKVLEGDYKAAHILDYVRSVFANDISTGNNHDGNNVESQPDYCALSFPGFSQKEKLINVWPTYKNIRELKTAGIRVMPSEKNNPGYEWGNVCERGNVSNVSKWGNISFTSKWFSGKLRLPTFKFDDNTPYLFYNLIAYEMCLDSKNQYESCSFISFMDSLIDTADDVKELRSAGIIQNLLGSDEELAKVFNELGNGLPTKMYSNCCNDAVRYSMKYIRVKNKIEEHYRNKWKTWLAEGYNIYFNTPWAIIAFVAAFLALLLTFVQTWYAIYPKNA